MTLADKFLSGVAGFFLGLNALHAVSLILLGHVFGASFLAGMAGVCFTFVLIKTRA